MGAFAIYNIIIAKLAIPIAEMPMLFLTNQDFYSRRYMVKSSPPLHRESPTPVSFHGFQ
jgi:hypothetical protein